MIKLNLESLEEKHKLQLYSYYGNDAVVPFHLRKYGVAKEDITIVPNHRQGIDYIIQNTETVAIDKPNEKCDSSAGRISISRCVSNFLEKELKCSTRLLDGNQTMKTCEPDVLKNYTSSDSIFKHTPVLSEANMLEHFGCMPSCSKNNIKLTMLNKYDRTRDRTSDKSNNYTTTLKLSFYFVDGELDIKEEFYIYDYDNFKADCGGYMGLLLGCSFLSLYHMVADWVTLLVNRKEKYQKYKMKALVTRKENQMK